MSHTTDEGIVLAFPGGTVAFPPGTVQGLIAALREHLQAEQRQGAGSPYLTPQEAAEYIRARPQRIYDLCSQGRLRRYKDGSKLLVRRDELDAHLASLA